MAVTIKDIAKETGLGNATISAYLNGISVRPYNKEKIETAIKKLGYIRNDYARGLKTHKSRTIGVLIPELSNIFSTKIITEMEIELRDKGYGIIVCDCRTNEELEQQSLRFLLSKMIDGLIVMPTATGKNAFEVALQNDIPVVAIDRLTDCKEVSHIIINNKEVAKEATGRLLDKGCKRIALITGDMSVYTARERRAGFEERLKEAGLYDEKLVFDGGLSIDGGYQAAKRILSQSSDIQGILVTNYEMSVGSMIALSEENKIQEDDFQFIGFDNVEMSKVFGSKIMTVNQPLEEIGRCATKTILEMINGSAPKNIVLKAQII